MLEITDIDFAKDKKYTAFSDAVKGELMNKLTNHSDCVAYASEIDRLQNMKSTFAEINAQ